MERTEKVEDHPGTQGTEYRRREVRGVPEEEETQRHTEEEKTDSYKRILNPGWVLGPTRIKLQELN